MNIQKKIVIVLFWASLFFQITALKYIWLIDNLSRIVNSALLALILVYTIATISKEFYSKRIWFYYLLPSIMICGGMFFNITINTISNFKLVSFYGLTLPWLTYLIIPNLIKKSLLDSEKLWKYYFYFMLIVNILGLLDYIMVFYGAPNLRTLTTPYGMFLGGYFSLFHMVADGTPHYRYYACFIEPGTLAMFMLPAITYAIFHKKFWSLIIFLPAFFLTDSLGGLVSLLFLGIIISFILFNRRRKFLVGSMFLAMIISLILWQYLGSNLIKQYQDKGNSAELREENFTKSIANLPLMLITNPTGFKLEEETKLFEKNSLFSGTNFQPAAYFIYGGILAFAGYIICLVLSIVASLSSVFKPNLTLQEKIIFSSLLALLPYIFQRSTIMESTLFALLYSSSLISFIEKKNHSTSTQLCLKEL